MRGKGPASCVPGPWMLHILRSTGRHLVVTSDLAAEAGPELGHPEQAVEMVSQVWTSLTVHFGKLRHTEGQEAPHVPQGGRAWTRERGQGLWGWTKAHFLSGCAQGPGPEAPLEWLRA